LEIFFLAAALYIFGIQLRDIYPGMETTYFFDAQKGSVPAFSVTAHLFTGLASLIASWALWLRTSWSAGWSMFTMGLLLYSNLNSLGTIVYEHPARAVPVIIMILVVLQSFPFMLKNTQRYGK